MLALVIVETEPGANAGSGLGDCRISVKVDLLVFEAAPQPLDKDVVHAPALAVHADHDPVPFSRASTQKSAASVLDSRQASTARLTQSMITTK